MFRRIDADGAGGLFAQGRQGGKTLVTLTLTLESTHSEEQQRQGWGAMLVNLETYLERKAA